jgi:hypothetical protein
MKLPGSAGKRVTAVVAPMSVHCKMGLPSDRQCSCRLPQIYLKSHRQNR